MEVVFVGADLEPHAAVLVARLREEGQTVRLARSVGEAELARRSGRVDAVVTTGDAVELRRRLDDIPLAAWLPSRSTGRAAELLELGVDDVLDASMGVREQVARLTGRELCVVHGDPTPGNIRMTADRVALIDWDESRVDVPDLDLVLPHNAADLDDDTHDVAAQAWAAWEAALCYTSGYHEFAAERLAEVRAV